MNDIEKILDVPNQEGSYRLINLNEKVKELQTYISNLLDSTALESEKYLDSFKDYVFDQPMNEKLWHEYIEQYNVEQHKRIKLVKEKI